MWRKWSRKRLIITSAAVLACLGLAVFLVPPRFRFALSSRAIDRDDAYLMTALARDLRQVYQWNPECLRPERVNELAAWVNHALDDTHVRSVDLIRIGEETERFRIVNGQLLMLDRSGQGDLRRLQGKSVEKIAGELRRRLENCRRATQDASYVNVLKSSQYQRLLARCDCSPFPYRSGVVRAVVSAVTGWRLADRERWVAGYLNAVERDVAPILHQYASIDRQKIVELNTAAPGRLKLRKRQNTSVQATVYQGFGTTTDFDLIWIPDPPADQGGDPDHVEALRAFDTGVRFVCVPWRSGPGSGSSRETWHPQWPPDETLMKCDIDRLREFLEQFGLPRECLVESGSGATVKVNAGKTDVQLNLNLSSLDFPAWKQSAVLQLSGQPWDRFRADVAGIVGRWRNELLAHVASLRALCDCPATITLDSGSARIRAVLTHPDLGQVPIEGVLGYNGRFIWRDALSTPDRQRLVQQLVKSNPSLRGLESAISLSSTTVDVLRGEFKLNFMVTTEQQGKRQAVPIVSNVNMGGTQETAVSIPDEVPIVDDPRGEEQRENEGRSPGTNLSRESFSQALSRLAIRKYPHLFGTHLRPLVSIEGNTAVLRFELQIADWPVLQLGPQSVSDPSQVEQALDRLLANESVCAASKEQWGQQSPLSHPRYGPVTPLITYWSHAEPRATVRCQVRFGNAGNLTWDEDFRLIGDRWDGLDDSLLADKLEASANEVFDAVKRAVTEYVPVGNVEIEVDPTGIDGLRWLSLNPPRMALKGKVTVSLAGVGVPLRFDGITVDSQGPHWPDEIGFEVPATLPLPYFAVSDALFMISPNRPSLRVGGKFTPPAPPTGPNPWLQIIYNEASVRGYWESLRFDGESQLAVARTPQVATGGMVVDFTARSLEGEMRAGGRLPGFETVPARAGGRVVASGASKSMQLDGRAELFDAEVASVTLGAGGSSDYRVDERFDSETNGFSVRGRVGLPIGLSANLHGQTSSSLEKYTIVGSGQLLNRTTRVVATEEEVRLENERSTKQGKVYWDEWNPNLTSVEAVEDERRIGSGVGRPASDPDRQFARRRFGWRRTVRPDPAQGRSGGQDRRGRYRKLEDVRGEYRNGEFRCWNRSNDSLVVRVPGSSLPDSFTKGGWEFRVWVANDDSGAGHLLLVHPSGVDNRHFSFSSPNSITSNQSLTLSELAAAVPDQQLVRQVAERMFTLATIATDDVESVEGTRALSGGSRSVALLDYVVRPGGSGADVTAVFWRNERAVCVDVHGSIARLPTTFADASFCEQLVRHEAQLNAARENRPLPDLVAYDAQQDATGWFLATTRQSREGEVVVTRYQNGAWQTSALDTAEFDHGLSFVDRLFRANLLARAMIREPALTDGTAWFGRKGVFVVAGDQWWIIVDRGLREPQVDRLSREAFVTWPDSDSATLLPADWKTEQQRAQLNPEEVASRALSDEYRWADRLSAPANWLGLLQSLAAQTPTENAAHE